jgi:MFS family permease
VAQVATIAQSLSSGQTASPSQQSLRGLDWLNFFLAGVLTGFGPFVAVYLADRPWTQQEIGLVLSIGGIASLVSQMPGGELLDATRSKQLLVAVGVVTVAVGALIFVIQPSFLLVAVAEALQGVTGSSPSPSAWSATPPWRSGSDATCASRPPAASPPPPRPASSRTACRIARSLSELPRSRFPRWSH